MSNGSRTQWWSIFSKRTGFVGPVLQPAIGQHFAVLERDGAQAAEWLHPDLRCLCAGPACLSDHQVGGLSPDSSSLPAREAVMAASDARYRALVETASVGVWHLDEHGTTLFANNRLARLFGGTVPATIKESGIQERPSGECAPFGFAAGAECRTVIPARAGRAEMAVLLAASDWITHRVGSVADAPMRSTILTLIDVSALEEARARADYLAGHDVLTSLPNRTSFDQALSAVPGQGSAALLLVDLDELRAINDRHGYAAGDAVLREVAARMRGAVRSTDLVCRLGGDGFAVLVRGAGAIARLAQTAERLSRALNKPVLANEVSIPLAASLGYARYPADASTADDLRLAAELALNQVRRGGRSGVVGYVPALREARDRGRQLRDGLGSALAQGRFQLVWQKQVVAASGALRGAEALLQWPASPDGEDFAAAEFVGAAVEAGLMPAIDSWMIETVLRQMQAWDGLPDAPPIVALKVSAVSLRDRAFPAYLAETLRRHRLPAPVLEIEIPGDAATQDFDHLEEVLTALRAIGVRVALDDFGGRFSSIAHLVQLPIDLVRLSRSIVAGVPEAHAGAMLDAVVTLARSMNIPLLADGIETEAQSFVLRREGCSLMQGALYGPPVSAAELVPAWHEGAADHRLAM